VNSEVTKKVLPHLGLGVCLRVQGCLRASKAVYLKA